MEDYPTGPPENGAVTENIPLEAEALLLRSESRSQCACDMILLLRTSPRHINFPLQHFEEKWLSATKPSSVPPCAALSMVKVVWLHSLGPTTLGTVSLREVGGPKHVGDGYLRTDERAEGRILRAWWQSREVSAGGGGGLGG